jgi:hypothetical protein
MPTKKLSPEVARYLDTLRRLPDDVVLDMAGREFDMDSYTTCVCGWAVRIELAKQTRGATPDNQDVRGWVPETCEDLFGGTTQEWNSIFHGVLAWGSGDYDILPLIELAFTIRVDEAVRNSR